MSWSAFRRGFIDGLAMPALFMVAGYGACRRVIAGDPFEDVKRDALSSRFTSHEREESGRRIVAQLEADSAMYEEGARH